MLGFRVIPCLDITNGRVVKGTNFIELKDAGNPIEIAQYYSKCGADEIVFLDITATFEERNTTISLINMTSEKVFIPLTVGGGVKTIMDIRNILNAGADKVSINSAAVYSPNIISKASNMFGKQCIVVAIDAKNIGKNKWNVFTHGGRVNTGIDAISWAKQVTELGAGEILLTSMDKDGTKCGYDVDLIKIISNSISIPVIASGGAGKLEHFLSAYNAGASAILIASLFHYKELTIKQVKAYLKCNNIPVRL
ncbi:MAG: imidazole glycerol phosphate synthase subunit HisF [Endomicrobium sp.]|jgi:cyclase|nr:imidazole glycerol phosphate synthase subunit HisF [Endomicrobium sp.]